MAAVQEAGSLTQDHYAERFAVFVKFSTHLGQQLQLFSDSPSLAQWQSKRDEREKTIRVLSVGTGSGDFDIILINLLQEKLSKTGDGFTLEYSVVEPNKAFLEQFKTRVHDHGLSGIVFHWHESTLEEFQAATAAKSDTEFGFELVFLIHSVYYLSDVEVSVSFILGELLTENGCLFTMASPENGNVTQVAMKWREKQGLDQISSMKTIADVLALEPKLQPSYSFSVTKSQHSVDIAQIFHPSSREGNLLLDFFTHHLDFRASINEEMVEEMLKFIKVLPSEEAGDSHLVYDDIILVTTTREA